MATDWLPLRSKTFRVEALVAPLLEDKFESKLACADQRSRRYSACEAKAVVLG